MYFGRKRKYAAKLRAQERKKPSRIISLLLVISMLCGNFVGMPTGAAEMVAYCGMEEHTHSEACYCAVQAEGEAAAETLAAAVPTEETAAETTEEITAPTEETALSVSGGSDAQALIGEYVEKELCCGMEEHKHDIACYSNPLADLETAAIWEATLPEKLSGDWGKDLAEVAKSQLGYAESAANYLVGADGETLMGYSRYGAWYSSYTQDEKQAYADWNVPFLFFCLYYAGVEDFPIEEDCADWTAALAAAELWREAAGEYIPEAGDLVFLDTDDDGAADRAAVVTDWDEAEVTAVESDSEGVVKTVTYDLTEDTQVLGYGDTNEAQTQIEVSGGEDAPELFATTTPIIYFAAPVDWTNAGYTIKVYVKEGSYSDDQTHLLAMNDTGKKDSAGRKIYRYTFTESECSYGGFYELYFQAFDSSGNWVCQYKAIDSVWKVSDAINGKQWTPNSTVSANNSSTDGSWGDYAPAEEPDVDEVTELPEVASGKRRVFYDATLSKLSYDGDSGSKGDYGIPKADSNVIYCWADQRYVMTKLASYTSGGHAYTDVYYVDIPSTCTTVTFASFALTSATNYGWSGESTTNLTIPGDYEQPCFYANSSDDSIYNSYDGNRRGGYWGEAFTVRDPGTVVDIPTATRENTADTLYLNTTFYDYYTDFELNGNNRDNYSTSASRTTDRIYQPFRHFNQALSSYYSGVIASNPLYWGNFQNYSGDHFDEIAGTLNLYGYSNNKNKFFAENNSMWGYDGGELTNNENVKDGAQATMGLVSNELTNGNLMIKTPSGPAIAPYFSKSFLEGGNSKNTVLGKVYENVSFPFSKKPLTSSSDPNASGTVDYWVFDSRDTTLRLKEDSTDGYWLDSTDVNAVYGSTPDKTSTEKQNFFPFNDENQSTKSQQLNYGFATKLELKFRLTEDGTVKTTENKDVPIEFNFSGDDDVWVFIDGKLALDVGGGHGRVAGYLNFQNKTYHVDRVKGSSSGVEYNKEGTFEMIGDNTDEHTLTMFYMERGLWESNMMITFNFPDENQLEVEKEVDMENVNKIFRDSFKNQKLFTFNIKNLATHFEDVPAKGFSYDPIELNVAGSGVTSYSGNTFDRGTYQNKDNALRWWAALDDTSSAYRHKRYGVLTLPETVDITNMNKLSFYMYYDDSTGFSLSNLYLQLLDADTASVDLVGSELTAGDNNALGCIGTSLAGKTYGSTSTAGKTWVKITLDLSLLDKGTDFDKTKVQYLRFGCNITRNIYLWGFTFEPAAQADNPTGFITQQYAVPSYGSATSGELEPAAGAVYTSSVNTNARASYVVDGNGNFALQHGETVNFHDQFRRGSYIYLEEVLSEKEQALYNTTWTMYENDIPVNSMVDDDVVDVVTPYHDMTAVGNLFVEDGRTEIVTNGVTDGYSEKNAYNGTAPADSFVFRSYADPDSTSITTKLRVKFTNKVNTGSLTISKEKAGTQDVDGTFTFYVRFYNVGGLGLESAPIVAGPITLSVGDGEKIDGIPLNTQYSIYEIKPADDTHITLDNVKRGNTEINYAATVYGESDAYRVDGTITGSETITYSNIYKPVVSLNLRKQWLDADGTALDDSEVPTSIRVQLQYRTVDTSGVVTQDWEPYGDFYDDITISPGYTSWSDYTYEFVDLDQNVYDADNNIIGKYEYRVVELDSEGNVITSTSTAKGVLDVNGTKYEVTYGTVEKAKDENNNEIDDEFTQTITNKLKPKKSITVNKVWKAAEDITNPTEVTVKLQRTLTPASETSWVDVDGKSAILKSKNYWKCEFTELDVKSGETEYSYRVVEVLGNAVLTKNGDTFTASNGLVYEVSFESAVDRVDTNKTNWTITNTAVPMVTLDITKLCSEKKTGLNGVSFLLEKMGTGDSWSTVGTGTTATVSEAAGKLTFTGLTDGEYRLTETQAADGYSLLASPITFTITKTKNEGVITYSATVTGYSGVELSDISADGVYSLALTIYNKPKLDMPATGGIHGFEFWILGGLLIMAVPLLMYTFIWYRKGGKYLQR